MPSKYFSPNSTQHSSEYKFTTFDYETSPELFKQYLEVRYEVFARELGWTGIPALHSDRVVREDPFDRLGQFVLAHDVLKVPIGIARGIRVSGFENFPHAQLFEHHLRSHSIRPLVESLATVNSVAVTKNYRGMKIKINGCTQEVSVGQTMMMVLLQRVFEADAKLIILTTTAKGRARGFFKRLGFYTIDPPFGYEHAPTELVNMGLLAFDTFHFTNVQSPVSLIALDRQVSSQERDAIKYFRQREKRISQQENSCSDAD